MIHLGGRWVEYRFARRRRRTLGITVDASGLSVALPLRAPWREVEAFLRDKERWVLAKLDDWARAPRPVVLRGTAGESVPLFGKPTTLEASTGVDRLLRWLKATAYAALVPRVAHYAGLLGRPAPRLALSNARTQWGVCAADGSIRLSWRLVHVEPLLADYVVAHEVAHLVELNHSPRFWQLLASLYPDWREARERLELAGAALPLIGKTR